MDTNQKLDLINQFVNSACVSFAPLEGIRPQLIQIADNILTNMGDSVLSPLSAANMATVLTQMTLAGLKDQFEGNMKDNEPGSVVALALSETYEAQKAQVTSEFTRASQELDTSMEPHPAAARMLAIFFSGIYGERASERIYISAIKALPISSNIWGMVCQNSVPFMKPIYDIVN